jgi:hypothetical protein
MAQIGVTVTKGETYGGLIDGVKSIRVFKGQGKFKNLKDDEHYITISINGMKTSQGFWEGQLSMPTSVARLVGQSLLDVTSKLISVEAHIE